MTLQNYLQTYYAPSTIEVYQREINTYINTCPEAEQAVYKDIMHYIGLLRQRYPNHKTIIRIVSTIKAYYSWLCHTGIRSDNPAKAIKLRDKINQAIQLQDLFTTAELESLLNKKERYQRWAYRNKIIITFLIYQALRSCEIAAITIEDINLTAGTIYIKSNPKTNARTLSLQSNQILLLHHYIHQIRPYQIKIKEITNTILLISKPGGPLKPVDINMYIQSRCKAIYPGRSVTTQTIRQSVIANLLQQGHDISIVQAFAGHKRPTSTERYKQSTIKTLYAAIQQYHPLQ